MILLFFLDAFCVFFLPLTSFPLLTINLLPNDACPDKIHRDYSTVGEGNEVRHKWWEYLRSKETWPGQRGTYSIVELINVLLYHLRGGWSRERGQRQSIYSWYNP